MSPLAKPGRAVHAYAILLAGATFVLIFAGGLVTSTGSGLSVPDWPLSWGGLNPPMVGGILYEHSHRLIAGAVLLLTIGLAILAWLREPRRWVRVLSLVALAAVVLQAVLGGMTVLFRLPTPVSVSHAALAQTFFCIVVSIALATGAEWGSDAPPPGPAPRPGGLRALAVLTVGAVYAQLLLGALMRHTGSGLAVPDFPLAWGQVLPDLGPEAIAGYRARMPGLDLPGYSIATEFGPFNVVAHLAHRGFAFVVAALGAWTALRVLRDRRADRALAVPARLLVLLLGLQILLGPAIVLLRKPVIPTTLHVAIGALLLADALVLALLVFRRVPAAARREGPAPPSPARA